MDCEFENRCLNNDKCFRCNNNRLLKLPEDKQKKRYSGKAHKTNNHKVATADNSWEDLEQQVSDALNKVPTMQEARRSRNSGALWFEKGDVLDSILHPECKERTGNTLKTAEQSMSIKREWLEKAKDELHGSSKIMCVPFRFKKDEHIYVIFDFNDIAELIQHTKALMMDNDAKTSEIEVLKKQVETLKLMLKN